MRRRGFLFYSLVLVLIGWCASGAAHRLCTPHLDEAEAGGLGEVGRPLHGLGHRIVETDSLNLTCYRDADCGGGDGHYGGRCEDGACECSPVFLPPCCVDSFVSGKHHKAWVVLLALVSVVQGTVVLLTLLDLVVRIQVRVLGLTNALGASPAEKKPFVSNPRDVAFLANGLAAAARLAWVVDPESMRGVYPPAVSMVFLLRLPQLLWVIGFTQVGMVWLYVTHSFELRRDALRKRSQRIQVAAWVFIAVLTILTAVGSALAIDGASWSKQHMRSDAANLSMGVAVLLLLLFGVKASFRVRQLLSVHEATATGQQRDRLRRVLRNTAITVVLSTAAGLVLVPSVMLVALLGVSPTAHAGWYLVFMYVTFVGVEGSLALTLFYSTRLPLGLERMCSRRRPELLAMLESHHSDSDAETWVSSFTPNQSFDSSFRGSFAHPSPLLAASPNSSAPGTPVR